MRKGIGTEVEGGMVPVIAGWPGQPESVEEVRDMGTWGFGMQAERVTALKESRWTWRPHETAVKSNVYCSSVQVSMGLLARDRVAAWRDE